MTFSYFLGWSCFRAVFAGYFHRQIYHPERVPTQGPVILAANHASYLDPLLVGASLNREINYLARKTLFRFPVIGALLKSWNAVPVDREGASPAGLKAILNRLLDGGAILLFLEGTRSRDGRLQPARSGVGLAVIKSKAPVVPVRIFGTFEAYGRHLKFPLPKPVSIKFDHPLTFDSLRAEAGDCSKARLKEIYHEVADEIMRAIAALEPHRDKTRFP